METEEKLAEIRNRPILEVHKYYFVDVAWLLELVDILVARNDGLLETRTKLQKRVKVLQEQVDHHDD